MPEITMVGGSPTVRWFRDPVLTIGSDAHGYRLLGLIKDPASNIARGGLWLQTSSKSLRMDDGTGKGQGTNALHLAKYPCDPTVGYSKAVVAYAPGVLKSFVEMFKGLTCFLPPTQLIKDEEGNILPGYENVTTVGTVTLEEMMDQAATSVARAPSTRKGRASAAPVETEEQLQAKLDALKAAREATAKAEADAKAAKLAEAKRLLAESEKAEAEMNGDEKVAASTKKDFVGKSSKAPIK